MGKGPGLAALAPHGLNFYHRDQDSLTASLRDTLTGLAAELGRPLGINSGYRSPSYNRQKGGVKNSYHMRGMAADIDMSGLDAVGRQALVTDIAQRGIGGIIAYSQYPNMLHIDERPRPAGTPPHFMFDKTASLMGNAPDWFRESAAFDGYVTPPTAPAPYGPSSPRAFEAPTATGDFMSSSVTASPARPDNYQAAGPKGNFNVAYSAPVDKVTRAPLGPPQPAGTPAAPSASALSKAYNDMGASLAAAGVALDGRVMNPAKAMGASLEIGPVPGVPVGMPNLNVAPVAPAMPAVPMETPVAPTIRPAVAQIVKAVSQKPAPVAPAPPSLSARDIYSGTVGRAVASDGSIVSGDQLGNTSVTNRYGISTTTTPDGLSFTSRGLPSLDRPKSGFMDGIFGSAQSAISDPLGSVSNRFNSPGAIPAIGGGILGGLVAGPIGGLVGAYLGNRFGGGGFPTAPGHFGESSGPALSRSEMDHMSPAASRSISSGKMGGLY